MYKKILPIAFYMCFLPVVLFSQEDTTSASDNLNLSIEELMDLKISSVSKQEEKLSEAPQYVKVITAEELRNRGYIDLEKVIHDLAGFDISRGNGTQYSQIYQRGYRSKNTERTLLLIDGVEENDLWSGNIWLSRQYALSNIERIEIIYGPASTLYGANAFVGAINIVTREPDDYMKSEKMKIDGIANYGSWNTYFVDATLTQKYKDLSIMITGRTFKSDEMDLSGYSDWDFDLGKYDEDYYRDILNTNNIMAIDTAMQLDRMAYYSDSVLNGNKPHYSNTTDDWLLYGKMKIDDFTIGLQLWKRNEGYGAWYRDDFELGPDHGGKWIAQNSFFYVKYDKKISDKLSISNHTRYKVHILNDNCEEFYYKGYFNREFGLYDLIDTSGIMLNNPAKPYWQHSYWSVYSQQIRSELKLLYNPFSELSIISGLEFRRSLIQGEYITSETKNPSETGTGPGTIGGNYFPGYNIGLYAQLNYQANEKLNLVAGGRFDYNRVRVTGGYGAVLNPKIALIYKFNNTNVKLIYSEAFNDAENWVKYGTTPARLLNNPNLQPEKVKNIEIGVTNVYKNLIFATISAYNANYSNVVGTVDVSFKDENGDLLQTTQHQAIGSLHIQGLQADVTAQIKKFKFYTNYTFTHPFNNENKDSLVRIGDIASHRINFGINYMYENLNFNLRNNWVGKRLTGKNTSIKNNPLNKIDPYFLTNLDVTYQLSSDISLQLSLNNIFNITYYHPGVRSANGTYYAARMPQNERNYMLKLLFSF